MMSTSWAVQPLRGSLFIFLFEISYIFLIVGKPFLQVSEHASWSGCFYFRIIQAALAAVGAPENLVDVITGSVYFILCNSP